VPIYEFACQSCGRPFEEFVWSTKDVDEVVCPQCGSAHVKRKISGFAAIGAAASSSSAACSTGGG
jgi:putative FmdB family regulatory protein